MKINDRVRYIHIDNEEDKASGHYPSLGTLGSVLWVDGNFIRIQWDNGMKPRFYDIADVEEITI